MASRWQAQVKALAEVSCPAKNSIATWGKGNARTDWNVFAQRAIRHLAEKVPEFEGVFFVEGVEGHQWDTKHAFWWGGEYAVVRFGLV